MKARSRARHVIAALALAVLVMALVCLFVGASRMSLSDGVAALFGKGSAANVRIVRSIRVPRVLAALIAGAALSVAGLVMQTTLSNAMASPSTMGVSNAAVFGANLSIIVFAGGYLSTGNNLAGYTAGVNPFAASVTAFLFSALSILLILALCRVKAFSPNVVVLAGIAVGAIWTAATTLLQFYATDVGLSAAVVWNFGDLGRATYKTDLLMLCAAVIGFISADAMRDEVERQDAVIKKEVKKMRSIQSKMISLASTCKGTDAESAVTALAEELRYSDIVSSESTEALENELNTQAQSIEQAIVDGDFDSVNALCRKMSITLAERNRVCKLEK